MSRANDVVRLSGDEYDRLIQEHHEHYRYRKELADDLAEARSEIERLRKQLLLAGDEIERLNVRTDERDEEIERLRAERKCGKPCTGAHWIAKPDNPGVASTTYSAVCSGCGAPAEEKP